MKLLYTIPVLALLNIGCSKEAAPEEEAAKPVVAVQTAKAETHDLTIYVSAPGTIFPRNQANVTARMIAPIRKAPAHRLPSTRSCTRATIAWSTMWRCAPSTKCPS